MLYTDTDILTWDCRHDVAYFVIAFIILMRRYSFVCQLQYSLWLLTY